MFVRKVGSDPIPRLHGERDGRREYKYNGCLQKFDVQYLNHDAQEDLIVL